MQYLLICPSDVEYLNLPSMLSAFVQFVRDYYQKPTGEIPLHEAQLGEAEQQALRFCLDSGVVSTVGSLVEDFEQQIAEKTGCAYAVATNSGTAALHLALMGLGVQANDLVITQPFCFVASCNAIRYCGADPLFVDIDRQSLGLSAQALAEFLRREAEVREDGHCYHLASRRRISLCLPVCTFGHVPELDKIQAICRQYQLTMLVDAAEALGSSYQGKPASCWGDAAILSFNGNKIVTSGGGGMLLTQNEAVAQQAHHLSVQARQLRGNRLTYDAVGYNYRMPNLNAALGLAQLEKLEEKTQQLRRLAEAYQTFFSNYGITMAVEPEQAASNYWLNAVIFPDWHSRDTFVHETNVAGILTRPAWTLMSHLPMYQHCIKTFLPNAKWAEQHLALLPSFIV
ncbi:LegC family aminotransferase [Catalinimonas niigatensis]|uniref:LegC family aminotransferase n=1 Tax=Catalinimonas niigatensis TaxID=1397264 RepID=UPI0026671C56|nr:LegC family aminotransferase [Catalinimonas niigatensis]WPP52639.1 LegC family aminotransferase [Catalinimonas niigatensis]